MLGPSFGKRSHVGHGVDEVPADDDELWPRPHPVEHLDRLGAERDLRLPADVGVLGLRRPVAVVLRQAQLRVGGLRDRMNI